MQLTAQQIRGARAMLGWSSTELARRAQIGLATVQRLESKDGVPVALATTLEAIQRALEAGGVTFLDDRQTSLDGGPGIRLTRLGRPPR